MSRDFDVADAIQVNLLDAGVFVHDGQKEWRADGVAFGDFGGGRGPGRTSGSRNDKNRDYVKSVHSAPAEGADDALIDSMVDERRKCKMMRHFDKADSIRDGLESKFNVIIDDRLREWSVGGDFGEEHNAARELAISFNNRGYAKSAASIPLSAEDEEYVAQRIQTRSEAKRDRDFDTADAIREELAGEYDVVIQDKLKMWSVGGDFGPDGPKPPGAYVRRGGGTLSDEDITEIKKMLKDRHFAKKNRDFDVADEIRDFLRDTHSISIDDRSQEWRVETDEYAQVSEVGCMELDEEAITFINAKIAERHAFKIERDYGAADDIRDNLNEKYGVVLDDRTREWRCLLTADDVPPDAPESIEVPVSQGSDDDWNEELDSILNNEVSAEDENLSEEEESEEEESVEEESEEEDSEEESLNADSLSSLTVVELKDKLREAGLPVSGKKSELVDRLLAVA
jgi:hypothetical protein